MKIKNIVKTSLKRVIPVKVRQYVRQNIYKFKTSFSPIYLIIFIHQIFSRYITPKHFNFLSWDIPKHITKEYYTPNDFYYHATCFKKYCGYNNNYQLKCSIEHGVYFGDYVWDVDINNNLQGIIFMGNNRIATLEKTKKKLFPIGPYIAYADNLLSDYQLEKERKRLGRNLLFFPSHSTHYVMSNYNVVKTLDIIKSYSKYFDTVRICLYWKDILRGYHIAYKENGFECVCAGHMYDKYFLPRLKSIISLSSMTMSSRTGTHVGYCVYMNKPHCIINDEVYFSSDNENEKNNHNLQGIKNKNIYNLFSQTFCDY